MNSVELRQKRAELVKQMRNLIQQAESAKRELTSEEQGQWDGLNDEADRMKGQVDRLEKQENLDAEMRALIPIATATSDSETEEEKKEKEKLAFRTWLVHGMAGCTSEQRQIMANRMSNLPVEARQQGIATDPAGGYLVADEFMRRIETAMLPFNGVRNTRATVMRTATGNDIHMPTSDDTSNSGELLGENIAAAGQDIVFGSKTLRAYMFSSKMVKASYQFLQDVSVGDIEGWLAERLGERIGRRLGYFFINGTGNAQPEGLAVATTLGETAAAVDAIVYDELVDLEHSVNPAYRRQGEFLLSDGALKIIKKLKDGEGRPLWVPGMAVREPDTILGYRYAIDMAMPVVATGNICVYFGDFSKFIIRDVTGGQLLRLTERYAEYLQVAFLMFSRHDSILLDAGANPVKYLQQA